MSAVIPTNSVLLDLNSRFATPDSIYGNGKFTVVVNNANKVNSCIKITPHRISIPNIFPNIRSRTSLTFFMLPPDGLTRTDIYTIDMPSGFYTMTELLTALNTSDDVVAVELLITGTLQLRITLPIGLGDMTQTMYIDGSNEALLPLLGFPRQLGTRTKVKLLFDGTETNKSWVVAAPCQANLGGEKLVHVSLRPISHGNLVSSNGYEYDILSTVPLHATKYGDYAVWSAPDLYTDDNDFPRQLTVASAEVELLDAYYEPLSVPLNYHVNVQLKCYHLDSTYSSSF
jgi:hypothetical protein